MALEVILKWLLSWSVELLSPSMIEKRLVDSLMRKMLMKKICKKYWKFLISATTHMIGNIGMLERLVSGHVFFECGKNRKYQDIWIFWFKLKMKCGKTSQKW